jgi:hypothetical protein
MSTIISQSLLAPLLSTLYTVYSLLLKKIAIFVTSRWVPKSTFIHTFLVSLKSSYSLDVPFGGLNLTARTQPYDPFKFSCCP